MFRILLELLEYNRCYTGQNLRHCLAGKLEHIRRSYPAGHI